MGAKVKHKLDELPILIVKAMHLAIQRMEMYGVEHSVTSQSLKVALNLIHELFEHTPSFTLSRLETQILFDRNPLDDTYFTRRFVNDFEEFNIHSVTFHRKMTDKEFVRFLRFMVRSPGRKLYRVDIEEYINEAGIEGIEVDKVKYVAVTGEVNETEEAHKVLTSILARHPKVIEKLLGESLETGELDAEVINQTLGELPADASELDVVALMNAIVKKTGVLDKDEDELSEADRELMKLIETVRSRLSETAKKEFLRRVEKISDDITVKSDTTSQLLEKEFTIREISLIESIDELLEGTIQKNWDKKTEFEFRAYLEKLFAGGEPEKASMIADKLFNFYDNTGAFWVIEALKAMIEEVFNTEDDGMTMSLLAEMLQQKETTPVDVPHFGLITAALVFFSSLLLMSQKYIAVYKIMRQYSEMIQNNSSIPVISDFETFISGLSSPENIHRLISSMGDNIAAFDLQLQEILEKMDGEILTNAIVEELGSRKSSFIATAADILKLHLPVAMKTIEQYVRNMPKLNRSDSGFVINSEQLRRTISIFSVAVRLDKEFALQLITQAISDRDIRIKSHLFFLLMLYPPEKVSNVIEKVFVDADDEFRSTVIEKIASRPNAVKDFYLREIFLHHPKMRIKIIKSLKNFANDYTKKFLLDVVDQWVVYIDPLPEPAFRKLLLTLIDAFSHFSDDQKVRKALKRFRSEWKTEGIVKESSSIFSFKKDEIINAVDEVLHK